MNILHLTLKKQWFDLILSGEKREEYREIKPYWIKRFLQDVQTTNPVADMDYLQKALTLNGRYVSFDVQPYDVIRFRHGYAKDAPFFDIRCTGIEIREGRPEWGAEAGKQYFVLKLEKF